MAWSTIIRSPQKVECTVTGPHHALNRKGTRALARMARSTKNKMRPALGDGQCRTPPSLRKLLSDEGLPRVQRRGGWV